MATAQLWTGDQAPVGANQDDVWVRTSDSAIFVHNGKQFVAIGAAPTGSAGGDLTGAYPSPTVAAGAITLAKTATGNPTAPSQERMSTSTTADAWVLREYNVKAYGAKGDGSTDDTTAVQNAINDAKTSGGVVYFPTGVYQISSLNATGISGVTFRGAGQTATKLQPTANAVHFLDLTGSLQIRIQDLSIGTFNQTAVPHTAILLAQIASNVSNNIHFDNIYVTGKYDAATLFNYGVQSCSAFHAIFYNYDAAAVDVVRFDAANTAGVASAHATVTTGFVSTSDWTFTGCEIHNFASTSASFSFHGLGCTSIRFVGGNISAGTPNSTSSYVLLDAGSNAVNFIAFHGTTLYTDSGTAPNIGIQCTGGTISDLGAYDCSIQAVQANVAMTTNNTLQNLVVLGKAGAATAVVGNGTTCTLTQPLVNCDGAQVNINAGTINGGLLLNPGTITASGGNTAVLVGPSGISLGGNAQFGSTTTKGIPGRWAVHVGPDANIAAINNGGLPTLYCVNDANSAFVDLVLEAASTIISDTGGFQVGVPPGGDLGAGTINAAGQVNAKRLVASNGTALTSGKFALSAGWGSTASVGSISGTDARGVFTVTASGTGQAANPTITLTFADGAWAAAPIVLCQLTGGTGITSTAVSMAITPSTTTVVFQPFITPVASDTYTFEFIAVG